MKKIIINFIIILISSSKISYISSSSTAFSSSSEYSSSSSLPNSSSTTQEQDSSSSRDTSSNTLNNLNPILQVSPLCVGIVCRNGVALLALHTAGHFEPLLLGDARVSEENSISKTKSSEGIIGRESLVTQEVNGEQNEKHHLRMLAHTKGPLRIKSVDSYGSSLVSIGWKTDCQKLFEKCVELVLYTMHMYGSDDTNTMRSEYGIKGHFDPFYYSFYLASGLYSYMSTCAFSDDVRSLCAVGLLATPSKLNMIQNSDDEKSNEKLGSNMNLKDKPDHVGGYLWMIDATGAYPCQIQCVGQYSELILSQLKKHDFSVLDVDDGASILVDIIEKGCIHDNKTDESMETSNQNKSSSANKFYWDIPKDARIELVILDSHKRKMRRILHHPSI